jgi:hypothetical protein
MEPNYDNEFDSKHNLLINIVNVSRKKQASWELDYSSVGNQDSGRMGAEAWGFGLLILSSLILSAGEGRVLVFLKWSFLSFYFRLGIKKRCIKKNESCNFFWEIQSEKKEVWRTVLGWEEFLIPNQAPRSRYENEVEPSPSQLSVSLFKSNKKFSQTAASYSAPNDSLGKYRKFSSASWQTIWSTILDFENAEVNVVIRIREFVIVCGVFTVQAVCLLRMRFVAMMSASAVRHRSKGRK